MATVKCVIIAFLLNVVCVYADTPVNIISEWAGGYGYSGSFWDGSQSVITEIKLAIGPGRNCSLSWEGFQKDEHILCSVKKGKSDSSADIEFSTYADGSVKNEYGVGAYQPGERLLSLSEDKSKKIFTTWGDNFHPPRVKKVGVFMKKID
jgi:hypothetical protein